MIPEIPPQVSIQSALTLERCTILSHTTKAEAIKEMISLLAGAHEVGSIDDLEQAIFRREQLMSTGIGLGIGLPHARLKTVSNAVMAMGVARAPIMDYESLDGDPVSIIVMVAAGEGQHAEHIQLLSQISSRLKNEDVREALTQARGRDEIRQIIIR